MRKWVPQWHRFSGKAFLAMDNRFTYLCDAPSKKRTDLEECLASLNSDISEDLNSKCSDLVNCMACSKYDLSDLSPL